MKLKLYVNTIQAFKDKYNFTTDNCNESSVIRQYNTINKTLRVNILPQQIIVMKLELYVNIIQEIRL